MRAFSATVSGNAARLPRTPPGGGRHPPACIIGPRGAGERSLLSSDRSYCCLMITVCGTSPLPL